MFDRSQIIDEWTDDELLAAYERSYFPGSKTSVFYYPEFYYVIKYGLNRTDPPKTLKDRLLFDMKALQFEPLHFLLDIFDQKLQQYIEADLINYNNRRWIEDNNPKRFEKYQEPYAILTLGELEAGFVVCMAPLALSVLVFLIEWIPTAKNLLAFHFIFKSFFEVKQDIVAIDSAKARMQRLLH